MGKYRIAHTNINSVPQRPYEYASVLTYRQLLLYTTVMTLLAGPIPAPHSTRFVDRPELLNSNMADPPLGSRGPF